MAKTKNLTALEKLAATAAGRKLITDQLIKQLDKLKTVAKK